MNILLDLFLVLLLLVVYFLYLEPLVRWLLIAYTANTGNDPIGWIRRNSWVVATPVGDNKFVLWAVVLWIFPLRLQSPSEPWPVYGNTVEENLEKLRADQSLFQLERRVL